MTAGSEVLERIFDAEFAASERTVLRGGAPEPLYRPAGTGDDCHRIFYREDFFASALHEVAHWCIAGRQRRQLIDYGYWYAPDGRGAGAQRAFEAVEARPQALEWLFSQACGAPFRLSFDNLDGGCDSGDRGLFAAAVAAAAEGWRRRGPPGRAGCFLRALRRHFVGGRDTAEMHFDPAVLDGP